MRQSHSWFVRETDQRRDAMKKTLLVCVWLALATPTMLAQHASELAIEQHPFRLYSAFWPNLHHVLWAEAWARRPSSEEKAAGSFPEPLAANLTAAERRAWDAAVSYYDDEIADRDLLFEM